MQVPVVRSGSVLTQAVDAAVGEAGHRLAAERRRRRPGRRTTWARPARPARPRRWRPTRRRRWSPPTGCRCRGRAGRTSAASTSTMTSPTTTTSRVSVPQRDGHVSAATRRRPRQRRSARPARRCAGRCGCSPPGVTPLLSRWKNSSRNGVTSLPRTCGALGGGQPVVQQPVVQRRVDLLVDRAAGSRRRCRGRRCRAPPGPPSPRRPRRGSRPASRAGGRSR